MTTPIKEKPTGVDGMLTGQVVHTASIDNVF